MTRGADEPDGDLDDVVAVGDETLDRQLLVGDLGGSGGDDLAHLAVPQPDGGREALALGVEHGEGVHGFGDRRPLGDPVLQALGEEVAGDRGRGGRGSVQTRSGQRDAFHAFSVRPRSR